MSDTPRRAITDLFIRHPVIALFVNLVIVLVGWRALSSLPIQQYPQIESSSVIITTVYYGASAETVRGFLTTPIERAVSAIGGVEYIESTSRAGVSTVTVRLKLNYNSTAALAEVTARLQQVRSELPPDAEPPVVDIQRTDRPYASFYLSFTSPERSVPELTDWLSRSLQPQFATIEGVQRVSNSEGGRPIAMRVWIDPDRLAAVNLAPGDVYESLQRNNYLAAVGQTKGNLVQVDLLANTDCAPREFANLSWPTAAARWSGCATWPPSSWARRRRSSSPSTTIRRRCTSACGPFPAPTKSPWATGSSRRWSASRPRCPRTSKCGWCGTARCSCATRSGKSARRWARRC
jgi:multidrug efflux pump